MATAWYALASWTAIVGLAPCPRLKYPQFPSCHAVPGCIHVWGRDMRFEDVRMASRRAGGVQDFIWTPHASELKPGHPKFKSNEPLFQERWAAREPIVVRGIKKAMSWSPDVSDRCGCFHGVGEGCCSSLRCRNGGVGSSHV